MAANQGDTRPDYEACARAFAERLSVPWWEFWRRPYDAELRKILARIYAAIVHASRFDRQGHFDDDEATKAIVRELLAAPPTTLGLDAALELSDRWDQLLIEKGDEHYVCTLLEVEYARVGAGTTVVTWQKLFGDKRLPASETFRKGKPVPDEQLREARNRLAALTRARIVLYSLYRARLNMKSQFLYLLAPALLVLAALFGIAVELVDPGSRWREIVLAGVAGAVGATMSGTFKLRDEVEHINALRAYIPALVVQPLLGASAALFLLLVLSSGIVEVAGGGEEWAVVGALAFVAGFSEPFLLGVVRRVAGVADEAVEKAVEEAPELKPPDEALITDGKVSVEIVGARTVTFVEGRPVAEGASTEPPRRSAGRSKRSR